jgi:hypothetical protein
VSSAKRRAWTWATSASSSSATRSCPSSSPTGGPHNKLGEGSAALFRELGEDRCRETDAAGHCKRYLDASIERGVLFFIFPGSKIQGLTPENALETVRREALRRFAEL